MLFPRFFLNRGRERVLALLGLCVCASAPAQTVLGTALVQRAPSIQGTVDGSVQQMLPESVTLNGGAVITGDLLVPGSPTVWLNGKPNYAGTIEGGGEAAPTNCQITLNGGASLRHVVRRTSAVALPIVAAPPLPTGTRNVTLDSRGRTAGDFSTLRNLTLNGDVGQVAVPPGVYGDFTANGGGGFTLGTAGATEPTVYHFQRLTFNGQAELRVVGPVTLTVAHGFAANGTLGASHMPGWLTLRVFSGSFTLNGTAKFFGYLVAPTSSVIINGGSQLVGGLVSDRLRVNGSGILRLIAPDTNQPPIAHPQSVQTVAGVPVAMELVGTDPDGQTLAYSITVPPSNGTLTPSSGSSSGFTYTPAAGFSGADEFKFVVNDGALSSAPATVSIMVAAVNQRPVAQPASISVAEDGNVTFTLVGTDPEASPLTYTILVPPTRGALQGTGGATFTYTPEADYSGRDRFEFQVNDGELDSFPAVVEITVTPVNDAPVAEDQTVALPRNASANLTLRAHDVDDDNLSYTVVAGPSHGTLTGEAPNVVYTPAPGYYGPDSFTFKATDTASAESNAATITLSVTYVNEPPTARDQTLVLR